MRERYFLISFLVFSFISSTLMAQTKDSPWAIGVYGVKTEYIGDMRVYGSDFPTSDLRGKTINTLFNFNMFHGGGALSVDHYLNRFFDAGIYASFGTIGYNYANVYDVQYGELHRNFNASLLNLNIHSRIKFLGQDNARFVPYITIGAGVLDYTDISTKQNDGIKVPIQVNSKVDYLVTTRKATNLPAFAGIISGGIGVEYKVSKSVALRYQADLGWTTSNENDLYNVSSGNDLQLQHSLGVVFSFGKQKAKVKKEVVDYPVIIPEKVVEETPVEEVVAPLVVEEPKKEEVKIEAPKEKIKITVKNITFDTGKYEIKESFSTALNEAVKQLKEVDYKIYIKGYTDNVGQEPDNLILSKNRAKAVKGYLIEKGIEERRITIDGFGESQPIADNNTENGRATNRRVEITIE